MYKVYILCSLLKNRHYVGHTNNIEKRLSAHNSGKTKSNKVYMPWSVIYLEDYDTKQ